MQTGILQDECEYLNEAFSHFIRTGFPFTVLKLALSLDGKIATRSGQSKWLTSEPARMMGHQFRAESDAILTTAETVLKDNSLLTVRHVSLPGKPPVRIILDRHLKLEPDRHAIFKADRLGGPVWLVVSSPHYETAKARFAGCEVLVAEESGDGFDLPHLLRTLGDRNITQLLVEAGGRLTGAMLQQRLIQKLWLIYGNKIFLDPFARPGFAGGPLFHLSDALQIRFRSVVTVDHNLVVEAYPVS